MKSKKWLWIIAPIVLLVIVGSSLIGSYNNLIGMEAEVDNTWAQVENVYQRRVDLIPNLVNTVQGSMKQEQAVFGRIADARQLASSATGVDEVSDANVQLNNEVQTLINVIHESYPDLASNENVQDLMAQLEGTENRISVERKRYNDEVTIYNKTIRRIPTNIVASITGFDQKKLFEMDEGADTVPTVEFEIGE